MNDATTPAKAAKAPLKCFSVHMRFQFPAHDERKGYYYHVTGATKAMGYS